MTWKELEHTGDLRLEIEAGTLEGLALECARAFYESSADISIRGDDPGGEMQQILVASQENDLAGLFAAWMNELLFFLEVGRGVFYPERIRVDGQAASLEAWGTWGTSPKRGGRVKAATYGGLEFDAGPPCRLRVTLDV